MKVDWLGKEIGRGVEVRPVAMMSLEQVMVLGCGLAVL